MPENNLNVTVRVSKTGINRWLGLMYSQQTNKQFTADGIQFTLLPSGDEPLKVSASGRSVFTDTVVRFSFIKPAGLFSVEGHGGIRLRLESVITITPDMQMSAETTLTGHEWIEAPAIQIGELNFPVESLSNCLIRYYKENILDKLDAIITEKLRLRDIVEKQILQHATNKLINRKPDIFLNATLNGISSGYLSETGDFITLPLALHLSALVSDKVLAAVPDSNPTFAWVEGPLSEGHQQAEVSLSYEGLAKTIKTALQDREIGGKKFEVSEASVRFTSRLEIKIRLEEPIRGTLTITCLPRIEHESQELFLDEMAIDVNADNFLYKLSSPIIENVISSKIREIIPLQLESLTRPYLEKIPESTLFDGLIKVTPKVDKVIIDSLKFGQFQVTAGLSAFNTGVEIEVNGLPEYLAESIEMS